MQGLTDRITEIIIHHLEGTISVEERQELQNWMEESALNKDSIAEFLNEETLQTGIKEMYHYRGKVWGRLQKQGLTLSDLRSQPSLRSVAQKERGFRVRKIWRRWAVAASIILALGVGAYFMFFNKSAKQEIVQTQQQRFKNDVNPGGYKARLTLANGNSIILDSAAIGELTKQGGTALINKDGELVYQSSGTTNEVLYNTLSTAKGETYATVLADGSKVWLNSGSSLKYPVAFVGNERRVEITGEAYFEVKHNDKMPFIVSVNGIEVHDLGTEFNVNAYADEAIVSTTLVQGSAKVIKGNKDQLLSSGQQAQVSGFDIKLVNNADVVSVTAWKNGIFKFNDASIEQLMKQLARWYDVEIVYEGKVSDHFVVTIPRNVSMLNALKILEETGGARFKVEGKKVTVLK